MRLRNEHLSVASFHAPKEVLSRISQVVVFSQPAAVNAVEAVNSFDSPMASCFACLGRIENRELTICQSVQGTNLTASRLQ